MRARVPASRFLLGRRIWFESYLELGVGIGGVGVVFWLDGRSESSTFFFFGADGDLRGFDQAVADGVRHGRRDWA